MELLWGDALENPRSSNLIYHIKLFELMKCTSERGIRALQSAPQLTSAPVIRKSAPPAGAFYSAPQPHDKGTSAQRQLKRLKKQIQIKPVRAIPPGFLGFLPVFSRDFPPNSF